MRNNYNNKTIKTNYIMNTLLAISSFIFPLITFPYVSRVLEPDGIGKVQFATSVVSYFNLFAQLGIPVYGIRAVAKVRDNESKLSKTCQELLIINLLMNIFAYSCLLISIICIPRLKELESLLLIISSTMFFSSIGMDWLFKGLEKYSLLAISSIFFKFIAVIATFVFINNHDDYIKYGLISIFASFASSIFNIIYAKKCISFKKASKYNFRKHIKALYTFMAMAFATTIYTNLDTVMLGFIRNDYEVGLYNAAIKIRRVLIALVTSFGAVLLPRLSYYVEHEQFDVFKDVVKKALYYVILVAVPLCVYFIVFSKEIIMLLSGSKYQKSIIPMQIIMPTVVMIGITNVLGMQIMVPFGKEKKVLLSELIGAIINIVSNLLLMPKYGVIGAAIGTLLAESSVLIYQSLALDTIITNSFDVFGCIQVAIVSVVSIVISSSLSSLINNNLLVFVMFSAISYFLVFTIMLFLFKNKLLLSFIDSIKQKH